jgi:hypothetical protein
MKIVSLKIIYSLLTFLLSDLILSSQIKHKISECEYTQNKQYNEFSYGNDKMECSYKLDILINLNYPKPKSDKKMSPLNFSIAEIKDPDGENHVLENPLILTLYEKINLNNLSLTNSSELLYESENYNSNQLIRADNSKVFLYFRYANFSDILHLHLHGDKQIHNGRYFKVTLNKSKHNSKIDQLKVALPIEIFKIVKYKSQAYMNKIEVIKSSTKEQDAIIKVQLENKKNMTGSFSLYFKCSEHILAPESIFFSLKGSEVAVIEKKIYVGSQYATKHYCNFSLFDSEGYKVQEIFQKFECKAKVYTYNSSEPIVEKRDSYFWEDIMEEVTKLFLFSSNRITTYLYMLLVDPDFQDNNRALMIYEKDVDYVSCQIVEMFHSSLLVLLICILLLKAR